MQPTICKHFGTCGGCTMQDRSDEEVAAWKQNQVVAALTERSLEAPVRGSTRPVQQAADAQFFQDGEPRKPLSWGFMLAAATC